MDHDGLDGFGLSAEEIDNLSDTITFSRSR